MSADIALVGTDVAELDPMARAVFVTNALVESKSWLAVATKGTDPTPIAEFKAWAATIAEMTRQKGLASEIQADALEMVRRAERGIGQAVRNGQEAGEIRRQGDDARTDLDGHNHLVSPTEFASKDELYGNGAGFMHAAEGTDEQFEEVLDEARAEGNLSRANVVRKIKGQESQRTRIQLAEQIEDLGAKGHSSSQIARQLGVGEPWVRKTARDYGIAIPADRVVGNAHRVDSARVAREIVMALDALCTTADLVTNLDEVDPSEAQQWTASLDQSLRTLNRLNKKIKEAVL